MLFVLVHSFITVWQILFQSSLHILYIFTSLHDLITWWQFVVDVSYYVVITAFHLFLFVLFTHSEIQTLS